MKPNQANDEWKDENVEEGDDTADNPTTVVSIVTEATAQYTGNQRRCCEKAHVCVYRYRCTSDCRTWRAVILLHFLVYFYFKLPIHGITTFMNICVWRLRCQIRCLFLFVYFTIVHQVVAFEPLITIYQSDKN